MSLKYDIFRLYRAVVTEKKHLNRVYAKVSYVCLNDKLPISLTFVIFEK